MYGMSNYGKLFSDELTEWFIEAGFIKYQCQMYIYYNYATDGGTIYFYLMLMTVSIGIHLKLLENGLCTL